MSSADDSGKVGAAKLGVAKRSLFSGGTIFEMSVKRDGNSAFFQIKVEART